MTSVYAANLCRLVEEGEVDEHLIDECCLRILELKNKLGLFENPYKDADAEKEKAYNLCPEHCALAKKAAEESFVLLKNDGVLPLDTAKRSHLSARIPTIMKSRAAGPSPATARTA